MKTRSLIADYYKKRDIFAEDYAKLGWETHHAQSLRFSQLVDNINLNGKSLLDVGCGFGGLLDYLNSQSIDVDYTGVDILPEMVQRAKEKYRDYSFVCGDIFREKHFEPKSFDVVYASGIFNLRFKNNRSFVKNAVQEFYNLAREAICFNLLHDSSNDKEPQYFYTNEHEISRIFNCLDLDYLDFQFIHGYLQNDFTVFLRMK